MPEQLKIKVTTQATPNRPRLWRERLGVKLRGYRPEPHELN
jgi:hypothetical protein